MTKPATHQSTPTFHIGGQAAGASRGVSRRAVLRGLGVAMALPMLESMMPGIGSRAFAQQAAAPAAGAAMGTPTRMAMVFTPNGVNYDAWRPSASGRGINFSRTLKPLEEVRRHVNVMTGLTLDKARANGDGPGDHARSAASFLTGRQARKTSGNDIQIGISVDQFAAQQVGRLTRLPSLELGTERARTAGDCDSGYSCAYTTNVAWADEDSPLPKMINPAEVFELMFGDIDQVNADAARDERLRRRASVLDYVQEDTARLERRLGVADRRKIDEFQTSIREIERRIQFAREGVQHVQAPDMEPPAGIPGSVSEHIDLMYDLMLLAFRMDITRVSTMMHGNGGSNRNFPEIGINDGHHELSHHRNNPEMVEKIRKIDHFYTERFARFVKKLSETPDGEGTLLDHTMVLYGSGISDGNRHNHHDLPIVMAGNANGTIQTGRLIEYGRETPLCNLYVSMLDRMGCDIAEFGDSTGRLDQMG